MKFLNLIDAANKKLASLLDALFTDEWLKTQDVKSFSIGLGLGEEENLEAADEALSRIDTKTGAILTHISMMVAAGCFLLSTSSPSMVEKVIVGLELTGYLICALVCIRCLIYRDLASTGSNLAGQAQKEYRPYVRAQVVRFGSMINNTLKVISLITCLFAVSLIVLIFY